MMQMLALYSDQLTTCDIRAPESIGGYYPIYNREVSNGADRSRDISGEGGQDHRKSVKPHHSDERK